MKIFGVLLFVVLVLGACVPKEPVVLRAVNVIQVEPGTDGEPVLKAEAVFYNPNATSMRLKRIDLDVLVDGKKTARIDQHLSSPVNAKSEFTVPLEVQLKLKEIGLLSTILNLFGGKEYGIQFVGSLKVKVHGFPVTVPVSHKTKFRL